MIFGKYAQTEGQMSGRDLLNFLMNEQREEATIEDAVKLIEKYEVDGKGKGNPVSCGYVTHTPHTV